MLAGKNIIVGITGGVGGIMGSAGIMGDHNFMHPSGWGEMLLGWLVPVGVIVLLLIGGLV